MNVEGLYEGVVEEIGVSHDGRRDPMGSGKPGYTSEDDVPMGLTSHGGKTRSMKVLYFHAAVAEHQNNLLISLKRGAAGSRLEGDADHVERCRVCSCTDLVK
jgi:hypothetical protein